MIMDVVPNLNKKNELDKSELELVENQKQEYKLIGKYLRTKGLRLFAYSAKNDTLKEVDITYKDAVQITVNKETNQLETKEQNYQECTIHSTDLIFEALNLKTAQKRLDRFKAGKIKYLENLREDTGKTIKLW